MLFDITEKFASKMSWSRTSSSSGSTSTTTTSTSTSGGGGGMCGGVADACYVYPDAPATPGIVSADVTFNRGIYMNGSLTMDDGKVVTIWGFTDTGSNGTQMGGSVTTHACHPGSDRAYDLECTRHDVGPYHAPPRD